MFRRFWALFVSLGLVFAGLPASAQPPAPVSAPSPSSLAERQAAMGSVLRGRVTVAEGIANLLNTTMHGMLQLIGLVAGRRPASEILRWNAEWQEEIGDQREELRRLSSAYDLSMREFAIKYPGMSLPEGADIRQVIDDTLAMSAEQAGLVDKAAHGDAGIIEILPERVERIKRQIKTEQKAQIALQLVTMRPGHPMRGLLATEIVSIEVELLLMELTTVKGAAAEATFKSAAEQLPRHANRLREEARAMQRSAGELKAGQSAPALDDARTRRQRDIASALERAASVEIEIADFLVKAVGELKPDDAESPYDVWGDLNDLLARRDEPTRAILEAMAGSGVLTPPAPASR